MMGRSQFILLSYVPLSFERDSKLFLFGFPDVEMWSSGRTLEPDRARWPCYTHGFFANTPLMDNCQLLLCPENKAQPSLVSFANDPEWLWAKENINLLATNRWNL